MSLHPSNNPRPKVYEVICGDLLPCLSISMTHALLPSARTHTSSMPLCPGFRSYHVISCYAKACLPLRTISSDYLDDYPPLSTGMLVIPMPTTCRTDQRLNDPGLFLDTRVHSNGPQFIQHWGRPPHSKLDIGLLIWKHPACLCYSHRLSTPTDLTVSPKHSWKIDTQGPLSKPNTNSHTSRNPRIQLCSVSALPHPHI